MAGKEGEREVWTGLVEVIADDGNDIFDGAPGAFANVLALASSVEDYMAVTAPALTSPSAVNTLCQDHEAGGLSGPIDLMGPMRRMGCR